MKRKIFIYLFLILILIVFNNFLLISEEQKDTAKVNQKDTTNVNQINERKNSEGTEFWVCFEKNYKESPGSTSNELHLELFITGEKDAEVNIEIDGIGYKNHIKVPGKTVVNVKIPAAAQVVSSETIERLGCHITSTTPISVYGLNRRYQTTDTYLAFPVNVLGKEYRAMCYTVSDALMPQFVIIATENNTDVTIIPSVSSVKNPANKPFKVGLNKGDVYQVIAREDQMSNCDLTGSLITATKKIAVFSGHQCAYVPPKNIACNHLVEMIPPIPSWGKHFYIGRLFSRSYYTYRVLANEYHTKVFKDSRLFKILNVGEFFEDTSRYNLQITADKPILVAQYSQGKGNGDEVGDPMMIMVSPTQQFMKSYRFATPINGSWNHLINVIAPTIGIKSIRLDGRPLDPSEFEPLGISRYSIAYIKIPFGTHIIEGQLPFGMYSYGFGYDRDAYDAYGTMAGQSFVDYEPAQDTLPPMADFKIEANLISIIFRDDRVDDSGIKSVNILENENLNITIPNIEQGMPQALVKVTPKDKNQTGRILVEVRDVVENSALFTICYSYDEKTDKFNFNFNEGVIKSCEPDPGIWFGAFGNILANRHNADFSSTGNFHALGNFSSASGWSGYGGFYAGRNITQRFLLSGRLSLENLGGTLEAPDSVIYHVRNDSTGKLENEQEGKNLKLTGLYLDLAIAGEYHFRSFFYGIAGIKLNFTLSKSVTINNVIFQPADRVFANGGKEMLDPNAPTKLSGLNSLKFGVFGGIGFEYPFTRYFAVFTETHYTYYLNSVINDASWNLSQLSLILGAKVRL